jgi:hypothetical protein
MSPDPINDAAVQSAILACDARFGATNYCNDQVWELRLGGKDPGLLAVQTTYGLRARLMRVFPRFSSGSVVVDDPTLFMVPPRVTRLAGNRCSVGFSPFFGIDALAEYWVPSSQLLVGRVCLTNHNSEPGICRMEIAAQLVPIDGEAMAPVKAPAAAVLSGRAGNLCLALFLTGGPDLGSGLYPSLSLEFRLAPGKDRTVMWALAAMETQEQALDEARKATARLWDAEEARSRQQECHDQLSIQTGDPAWDAVLEHSQRAAYRLFHSAAGGLPNPSFVLARTPEMGYSRRCDGSEYNYLANGQTALDALHMASVILPGGARWVQGLLRNFLAAQSEGGEIDWKPGLGGQRSRLLAQPVLAELAWRAYRASGDERFLVEVYPGVRRSLEAWFSPDHDRDQDGYPEWSHLVQTGLEESALFNPALDWSQGVDPVMVETPALASFLYRECRRLVEIAVLVRQEQDIPRLEAFADRLKQQVLSTWDAARGRFLPRDRETHGSTAGEVLFHGQGPSVVRFETRFDEPRRLVIRVRIGTETTRPVRIRVIGQSVEKNEEEVFTIRDLQWVQHHACLTTRIAFAYLEHIDLDGFDPLDDISIETVDFLREDLSLFLPLWAGIASPEQAGTMVQKHLLHPEQYGQHFGLPYCPGASEEGEGRERWQVSIQWNALIVEGMLRYGYRQEAAEVMTRLMRAATAEFHKESGLRTAFDALNGRAWGERDHLAGLFPTAALLGVLGIPNISPGKVFVEGNNPFPWPVTVKYRGMRIHRQTTQTLVTFPDGQTALVTSPELQCVEEVHGGQPVSDNKEEE